MPAEDAIATIVVPASAAAAATEVAVVNGDQEEVINPYEEYLPLGMDIDSMSPVRRFAIKVCANPDFEMLVTFVIFANCLTLTLYDPMQPENSFHNMALFWTGGWGGSTMLRGLCRIKNGWQADDTPYD